MNKVYARAFATLFLLCIQLFSSITSYSFFASVFRINPVVSGLIGLLLLDVAFVAWLAIRMQLAESRGQIAASTVGAIVGFLGSSFATFGAMFGATSEGISGDMLTYINYAFSAVGVLHVALATVYNLTSRDSQEAIADANRKAEYAAQIDLIKAETDRQVFEQLRKELPSLAAIGTKQLYHNLLSEYANPLIASQIVEGDFTVKQLSGRARVCQNPDCQNDIPASKRSDAKYCSTDCRKAVAKTKNS